MPAAATNCPISTWVNTAGAVVYSGIDRNDAVVAMVEAITDLPAPGQIISGVVLRKFKALPKTIKMGNKAEGAALAPLKAALKSKKPGEAEEAQAVLEAIEKAKKNLEAEITDALAAGDKGMALRDMNWFMKSWPSEKDKYAAQFKQLSADPEAVKSAKELMAPGKKRR